MDRCQFFISNKTNKHLLLLLKKKLCFLGIKINFPHTNIWDVYLSLFVARFKIDKLNKVKKELTIFFKKSRILHMLGRKKLNVWSFFWLHLYWRQWIDFDDCDENRNTFVTLVRYYYHHYCEWVVELNLSQNQPKKKQYNRQQLWKIRKFFLSIKHVLLLSWMKKNELLQIRVVYHHHHHNQEIDA